MNNDKITLSEKDILEKDFNIDTRGYRMQEVDRYLDIIIKDYALFTRQIRYLNSQLDFLTGENETLKLENRNLNGSLEAMKYEEKEITNIDIIRRLSQLEKAIYSKEEE